MTAVLQTVIDGLLIGGVYGVISVGLSIVFGVLRVVNFAQAEFLTLGMYTAWLAWSVLGIDPMLGAFLSLAVGFLVGAAAQRFLVQHALNGPPVAQIFLTVGLLIVMENGMLVLFGSDYRSVITSYQTQALEIGPFFISVPYLLAFTAAVAASGALWLLLEKSWLGRAIRATAQSASAASAAGVDAKRIYAIAFGLGTGMTAFGGGIILPYATVNPTTGAHYVVIMFVVVVLGGLGSVSGALIGGLVAGVVQSLSSLFFPIQLQNLVLFLVFILLIALRPQGLLGEPAR